MRSSHLFRQLLKLLPVPLALGLVVLMLIPMANISAQEVDEPSSFTDLAVGGAGQAQSRGRASSPEFSEALSNAFLDTYQDRSSFNADWPELPFEDFEATLVPTNNVAACYGRISYQTNDACYSLASIRPGVVISPTANNYVVLTEGYLGVTSTVVGPNTFMDNTDITFPDTVQAVGLDLLDPLSVISITIDIYGPGNVLLGTDVVSGVGFTPVFWGVASKGVPISRLLLTGAGTGEELIDNIAFGGTHNCDISTNPVANCSFETGDFSNWLPTDLITPFYSLQVTSSIVTSWPGSFYNQPTHGSNAALNGFDGAGPGTIQLSQDVSLPPGTTNLLFDYRTAWSLVGATQDRQFIVDVEPSGGGAPLQTTTLLTATAGTVLTDTGKLKGNVDLAPFAGSDVRLKFLWNIPQPFTGPAFFQLDNVLVDVIPIIEVNPASLASSQTPNKVIDQNLRINNLGGAPLDWSLYEAPAALSPLPQPAPGTDKAGLMEMTADPKLAAELAGSTSEPRVAAEPTTSVPKATYQTSSAALYDNGPLVNDPGGGFGGADGSQLQTVSQSMNTLGFGHQQYYGNRISDEFTVTASGGWAIGEIAFFAYQTGSSLTSTMTAVNFRIWDGVPGDPASNVVFGDLYTNRMLDTTWSGIYRTTETDPGMTFRPIMTNTAVANVYLPAGTYWLDWQTEGSNSLSGPWAPPITISGTYTTGNGLQSLDNGITWNPARDSGFNLAQQGFPFVLYGCELQDIPWLSVNPLNGVIPGVSHQDLTVTFDSTGMTQGSYAASLCVLHNEPLKPLLEIPVDLTVVDWMVYLPTTMKSYGP